MKEERDEVMERVRAVKTLVNAAPRSDDLEIEGFMALFHPKKSKDRHYMAELKRAMKK